jgi:2-dehydro-3-deoxyphosphooctonate aldolase (KDO 8-P synthase)
MRNLVVMREFAPVIFDATHSVQMPTAQDGKTGGDSSMVPYLASGAAAVGVDGFFMETHFDPACALSDGPNMIRLDEQSALIEKIKKIQNIK